MVRLYVCLAVLVMLVVGARPVEAQTAPSAPNHGWLDLNYLSLRSTQDAQAYAFADTIFAERRTFGTAYPKLPSAERLGIDFGFHITPRLAAGINFNAVNYEYQVGLAIEVPHPLIRNRYATDTDVTVNRLKREDRGLDLSVIFVPPTPDAWRVRLFGGPTYFRVKQDMVSDITYNQSFNLLGFNSVDIQRYESETPDGTAWGFHAGIDVGYFFSRYVGVGGVLRFNRGTVTVDEPLRETEADLKAGHTTLGGGLRVRF